METVKCVNCGKCFMRVRGQEKCPHCKENYKPDYKGCDLPEGFEDLFGINK